MSKKFNASEDGAALGYWVGSSLFGAILGYFLFTFLIYGVSVSWVWCLIISSILNLLIVVCFKLKLEDNEVEQY